MRSIWILVVAIAYLFGLSECKKSVPGNSVNGGGLSSTMVRSYELIITDTILLNTSSDYTYTYSYDNNNRQTAATQMGTDTYKGTVTTINFNAQFTYSQGAQTETGLLQKGGTSYSSSSIYYLNSSSYPTRLVLTSNAGTISTEITNIYTYDANGYCTEIDNTSTYNNIAQPATKTLFTISTGNVIRQDNYLASGSIVGSTSYTFSNTVNKTDQRFSTAPDAGHLNNNLVQSSVTNTMGIPKSALNYSYSLDSKGRPNSAIVTTNNGKTFMQYKNIQYLN